MDRDVLAGLRMVEEMRMSGKAAAVALGIMGDRRAAETLGQVMRNPGGELDPPVPRIKEIRAFARGLADAVRKGRLVQEG